MEPPSWGPALAIESLAIRQMGRQLPPAQPVGAEPDLPSPIAQSQPRPPSSTPTWGRSLCSRPCVEGLHIFIISLSPYESHEVDYYSHFIDETTEAQGGEET